MDGSTFFVMVKPLRAEKRSCARHKFRESIMALITCSECGKQFSDTAAHCPHCGHDPNSKPVVCPECGHEYSSELASCPNCGFKTHRTSKIIIHGYKESFAMNPAVKISIEGRPVGSVEKGGTTEVEIDHDCIIDFSCSVRTTRHAVKVGQKEHIMLSFNRATGALSASTTTDENYAQDSINAKEKDKKRIFWIVIIILLLLLLPIAC